MNAIVVYESIYGNTRAIAEAIVEGLGGAPLMTPGELSAEAGQADLLVVGGPTHIHGMATDRSRRVALESAGACRECGRVPTWWPTRASTACWTRPTPYSRHRGRRGASLR